MSKEQKTIIGDKVAIPDVAESDNSDGMDVDFEEPSPDTSKKSNVIDKKELVTSSSTSPDDDASSVIYIGHLPSEFQEHELLDFLSQFGEIDHVKLSRSNRTGRPRGYAFVKFADKDVASIVADTMSGYFLGGTSIKRLVCHILPKDKVHADLFKGLTEAGKKYFQFNNENNAKGTPNNKLEYRHKKNRMEVNKTKSSDKMKKITQRLLKREEEKRKKLSKLGIEYDFPGYAASVATPDIKATDVNVGKTKKRRKISLDAGETVQDDEKKLDSKRKGSVKVADKSKGTEAQILIKAKEASAPIESDKITKRRRKDSISSLDKVFQDEDKSTTKSPGSKKKKKKVKRKAKKL